MKCSLHTNYDAVGVCSKCGRGVCSTCAISIGGKIYCTADIERTKISAKDRGAAITIVSIIFYIFGVVEIVAGLSILSLANIVSSVFFYTGVIAGLTIVLGIGVAIIGILDFLAGRWLWRAKRRGGILGFITAIISVILNTIFIPIEPTSSVFGIILSIVVITLIAIGWKKLQ